MKEIEAIAADAEKPAVDTEEGEEVIALSCFGLLEEPLTESPPRALPTRDIEELLRDVAPCNRSRSAHMWLCALEGLAPEDVPYSVFGVTGFRYKASSTTTNMPSAVASSSPDDTTACDSRYLGVWEDFAAYLSDAISSESDQKKDAVTVPCKLPASQLDILFGHRPR